MLTLERLSILNRLANAGLNVDLTCEYSLEQLAKGCDMLERENIEPHCFQDLPSIQCALMENPAFVSRYQALARQGVDAFQIEAWLKAEQETHCRLMEQPMDELLAAFRADLPHISAAQEYLLYFLGRGLEDAQLEIVQANLRYICGKANFSLAALDEPQRELLLHPFVREFLFRSEIAQTLPLLAAVPPAVRFLDKLHAAGLNLAFTLYELELLSPLGEGELAGFQPVFEALGNDPHRMERFLSLWLDNGGHPGDLKPFLSAAGKRTPEELDAALETRLSYLNLLYGGMLDGVPFQEVPNHALPLLSCALANRQRTFLRLVAQNFDLICELGGNCILFSRHFYSRIALNSITLKNLRACLSDGGDRENDAAIAELEPRLYTFEELRALRSLSVCYARLYNRLTLSRVDDRLLALRQLTKRRLLPPSISDAALDTLAARLSEKPLSAWRDQEFHHISGLSLRQCVQLLSLYDQIVRFIPEISTESEAAFIIRQAEKLADYACWADVVADIEQIDAAWGELRKALELDDAFVQANQRHILPFLFQEGASIAMAYERFLTNPEGFRRIVRAQLMGKYQTLKYFRDDLDREISLPISDGQKQRWTENTALTQDGFEISERDDFFTTMRIGEVPQFTCLNYRDGAYRECLLACFDSNKKFLYAMLNGKPVARAMLRLTKGRANASAEKNPSLEFADLRLPDSESSAPKGGESLVLFLEHPYTNGLNEAYAHQVRELFVCLAVQKAAQLNALPVLSASYIAESGNKGFRAMNYALYISRSKAGTQYLDSLGGANGTSSEGSYRNSRLLLPVK
jgi:hypothetical protein